MEGIADCKMYPDFTDIIRKHTHKLLVMKMVLQRRQKV